MRRTAIPRRSGAIARRGLPPPCRINASVVERTSSGLGRWILCSVTSGAVFTRRPNHPGERRSASGRRGRSPAFLVGQTADPLWCTGPSLWRSVTCERRRGESGSGATQPPAATRAGSRAAAQDGVGVMCWSSLGVGRPRVPLPAWIRHRPGHDRDARRSCSPRCGRSRRRSRPASRMPVPWEP
jgi:hypothetical protein